MKKYLDLYRSLGLPEFAIELASDKHASDWLEPVRWRAFPPAFLPLFQHWNKDVGYWKHWFTPQRNMTIVEHMGIERLAHVMSVGEMISGPDPSRVYELLVTEIATNMEQLVRILVLDWLCSGPGEWNDEIRDFAAHAGLTNSDTEYIDAVSINEYRAVAFLGSGSLFEDRPPLSCFPGKLTSYPGDFPHPQMDRSQSSLRKICSYEIHSSYMYDTADSASPEIREELAEQAESPPWLKSSEQCEVFDLLLDAGDLSGAWMSLNSFAWNCGDAVEALLRLAAAANDDQFSLLADAYGSLDHETDDGY